MIASMRLHFNNRIKTQLGSTPLYSTSATMAAYKLQAAAKSKTRDTAVHSLLLRPTSRLSDLHAHGFMLRFWALEEFSDDGCLYFACFESACAMQSVLANSASGDHSPSAKYGCQTCCLCRLWDLEARMLYRASCLEPGTTPSLQCTLCLTTPPPLS